MPAPGPTSSFSMNPEPTQPSVLELAKMIDHSLLHPTMTDAQLDAGCALAIRCDVATVCVKPYYVPRAAELGFNGSTQARSGPAIGRLAGGGACRRWRGRPPMAVPDQ